MHWLKKILGHLPFFRLTMDICSTFRSNLLSRNVFIPVCPELQWVTDTDKLVKQPGIIPLVSALPAQVPVQIIFSIRIASDILAVTEWTSHGSSSSVVCKDNNLLSAGISSTCMCCLLI